MAGERVLYIDDDVALARLTQRTLERAGYAVDHAPNGQEGLARLSAETFDVVALDHHMPGETGLDVLERIKALPSPPPVIYVTGSEASHVAVAALKAGAVDYVWKDVQGHFRELLTEAVGAALRQEAMRRARQAADRAVLEARDRAEMLLKEVNHRLANSLALVASFARLQAQAVADPEAKAALEVMQARIHAIAGVHRRLYSTGNVERVQLNFYLQSLTEDLQQSLRTGGREHEILVEAEEVEVPTDRAVSIGVMINELVTNAFKYAYPPGVRGDIRIVLSRTDQGASITVTDDGVGFSPSDATKGTGLGGKILRAMASSVGALDYPPVESGTKAVITFKA
jgi:two-component sensor histidine kinase